jgi:hypothetical protein
MAGRRWQVGSLLIPPVNVTFFAPLFVTLVEEGESRTELRLFIPHAPTDPEFAPAPLSGLTDEAQSSALARFQTIRP